MAEDNQKVVVMNTSVPVEAHAPLPVTAAASIPVDAKVVSYPPQRYEYKVFRDETYHRREAGRLGGAQSSSVLAKSLEMWLSEGWEIHFAARDFPALDGGLLVLRRPS